MTPDTERTPGNALPYSSDEVIGNFEALLASFDFTPDLDAMGIGKMQLFRRRRALFELRALFVALWRIALDKSLPGEGELVFEMFLSRYEDRHRKGKQTRQTLERVRQYVDLLLVKRDTDFTEVASHLVSFLTLGEAEAKALRLRLTLHIRSTYNLIFAKLL